MAKTYSIATKITAQDAASGVLRNVQSNVDRFSRSAKNATKVNASMWGQMKAYAGGQMLYNTVSRVANFMFDAVRESEDAVARFVPKFGGDMQKTKAFVDALNKSAAETPFQFNDLASAADTLMGFGVANAENAIQTMNILGDVAGGNAQRMQSIVLAYSQSMAAGKANMQDMNQLINAGVPILGELAKMYKVNVGVMRDMISRGKITSTDIEKVFKRMTSSGGMFFEGMKIQSKTLSGQLSTLQDNLKQAAAKTAGPIIKTFTPVLSIVGDVVSAFANMPATIQGGLIAAGAAIAMWAGGVKGKLGGVLALIGAINLALDAMNDTEEDLIKNDITITKIDKMKTSLSDFEKETKDFYEIPKANRVDEMRRLYEKFPALKEKAISELEFGEMPLDLSSGRFQAIAESVAKDMSVDIARERVKAYDERAESLVPKTQRLIANPMYSMSQGKAAAETKAVSDIKLFQMQDTLTKSGISELIRASIADIKYADKNPVYTKAYADRMNQLLDTLKQQKSNIDVNIRVDQEGNVTSTDASAKSTGVNLRQAVRFNP